MNHEKNAAHFKGYLVGRRYFKAMEALTLLKELQTNLRKDGKTPYWTHPLSVANYIRTLQFSENDNIEGILIVALAHDILEDTGQNHNDFDRKFGNEVYLDVLGLTKQEFLSNEFYYKKMLVNWRLPIVKAADRMHNLSTMVGVFSNEKIGLYIAETEEFVLPMLSAAKKLYPEREAIYENLKTVINIQLDFARAVYAQGAKA